MANRQRAGAYTVHETREFGASVGLLIRTTPAYSPESNGMAESFVKSFKRDYLDLARLHSAEVVLQQLPAGSTTTTPCTRTRP